MILFLFMLFLFPSTDNLISEIAACVSMRIFSLLSKLSVWRIMYFERLILKLKMLKDLSEIRLFVWFNTRPCPHVTVGSGSFPTGLVV